MVIDTNGYIELIQYLTEHLALFEGCNDCPSADKTVMMCIEEELCEQIINVCSQNSQLEFEQRNTIIREVDSIFDDLEEVLSGVINQPITAQQQDFIKEFTSLIKNLFDIHIHTVLNSQ
jgi:Fe-S cluster biogenesis protein NfuA